MPPHGRRRASLLPVLLFLLSCLLPLALAVPSVIGIDIGTENLKAVLVKPGIPLDIVLAKDSKRKEPAVLAFKPGNAQASSSQLEFPERLWGSDAVAIASRFPGDVYANLKPLLGVQASREHFVATHQSRYPGMTVTATKDRNTVCMKSETFKTDEEPFTVEELLGMQLQNVRANAEAMAGAGTTVRDAVVTIPPYFTAEEKRAVQTAAELAGLKILAMTTDGLAVGLNYATSRTFPVVNEGAEPEYHMVFDMGAGSATATILRFQGRKVKDVGKYNKTIQEVQVVGAGWDRTLGGDALNAVILEDLVAKLAEHKQMKADGTSLADIKKHGRTMAKLWKEVQRMRQVLSANTETQATFEGLYHSDLVFKYKISRAHFEKLAADFEVRVANPITQALAMAKLELKDIESVILHGGAQRTPFVQKALETAVGSADKLKTNVNSDEAAAFGAAFKAAGLVPSFRVKEIRTSEAATFPASMAWTVEGKDKHQTLFGSNSLAAKEKQVPFQFKEDFSFVLSQQVSGGLDGPWVIPISTVSTTNLTAAVKELKDKYGCEPADIKTQLSVGLSSMNGLPEATRGSVSCEAVEAKKGGVMDGVKGMFGFGKKDDQQSLNEKDAEPSSAEAEISSSISTSSDAKATDAKAEKIEEPKIKTQTVYVGLKSAEAGQPSITTAELQRIKDRMKAFDQSDKNRKLREEALNSLEGYTYKIRDIIEDSGFIAASSQKDRDQIEKKAREAGDWIYGDGADAKLEDFQDRLKELKKLVDPIALRKDEATLRPEKLEHLKSTLNQTKVMLEGLFKEHEEKKVAVASSSASLSSIAAESSASAASAASEASASPSTTDPASVLSSSLKDELEDLDDSPAIPISSDIDADPNADAETIHMTLGPDGASSDSDFLEIEQPVYKDEELAEYQGKYEALAKWYNEKAAAQEKLKPTDTPAVLVSELTKKADEVQNLIVDVVTKQMANFGTKGRGGGKKKSSSTKSKSKSKKTKTKGKGKGKGKKTESAEESVTGSESVAGSEPVTATESEEGTSTTAAVTTIIKDEL